MGSGPDVVGRTEAAAILGLRPGSVREKLKGLAVLELANGPVWATEAVTRVAAGEMSRRKPPATVGVKEAAELLGVAKANVGKWCERRSLPGTRLAQGTVWLKRDVERGVLMESSRWKGRR
jgi:DNA-binding transcriptional regulator YdaS (Cro superfamily)